MSLPFCVCPSRIGVSICVLGIGGESLNTQAAFILLIVGALLLCVGVQFCRDRWLRLLAGNWNASKADLDEQYKGHIGRPVGVIFVGLGLFFLLLSFCGLW